MLSLGEISVFVTDLPRAVRFWADGLGLKVAEEEIQAGAGHARLDFKDDSPAIRLIGPVEKAEPNQCGQYGQRPMIGFDLVTTRFEETMERLLEHGGTAVSPIEQYGDMRIVQMADPDGNVFELVEVPED